MQLPIRPIPCQALAFTGKVDEFLLNASEASEYLHATPCVHKALLFNSSMSSWRRSATRGSIVAVMSKSDSLDRSRDDDVLRWIETWVGCVMGALVERPFLQAAMACRLIVHQTPMRQNGAVVYTICCALPIGKAAVPANTCCSATAQVLDLLLQQGSLLPRVSSADFCE